MLRRSELVGWKAGHVAKLPGGGIELFLPRSKTVNKGAGRGFIYLAPFSGSGVLVARSVLRHLGMARRRGATDSAPLFVRVEGHSGWGKCLGKAGFTQRP